MIKKNILVTGAAGFIGSHAIQRLQRDGHFVLGYDNFNDYYDVALKYARVNELQKKAIEVIHGDVTDLAFFKKIVDSHAITHILHLAAQAGVRYSLQNPQGYLKANIDGFLNVLEICRSYPHIHLAYASSSSVYGLNTKTPFCIEDRTDQQASLYGVTKKTNELMAKTYKHLFAIKAVGLRFFTVYGPWGRPDMAYYSFTQDILSGKELKIFNNGQMKRDFTYIDDIVEGIVAALDYQGDIDVFNLGNNQPVELGQMIAILEDLLGKKAKKTYLPMQAGDVVETYADISASQQHLNFNPLLSLSGGLEKFVGWYKCYSQST